MSIGANVAYPLRRQGVARSEITGRVREALRVVDLAGYEDRKIGSLSGGQQQRVALARTIVGEPRVLLFDEPLSNLDAGLRESMRSEIRRVHDRIGTTCIYVTHDQTEAITLSDRVVVMRNGQIEQVGTPREIFERPVNRFVADFVGVENFLPGTVYSAVPGRSSIRLDGTSTVIDVPTAEADQPSEYPALLAFRSRSAALAGAAGNSPAALNGRVTQRVYLGDEYQFTIQTDAGTVALRARGGIDAPETLAGEGDRVAITLDPHRVVVLARD
jgi:iron(III) transport system ATP-binding protein